MHADQDQDLFTALWEPTSGQKCHLPGHLRLRSLAGHGYWAELWGHLHQSMSVLLESS